MKKKKKLGCQLIALCLVHLCLVNLPWFSFYSYLRYFFLVITGLFIVGNGKILVNDKRFFKLNMTLLVYVLLVFLSSWLNRYSFERNVFLASIVGMGTLIEVFFGLEVIYLHGELKQAVRIMSLLLFIYVLANDMLIFLDFSIIRGDYFLGNKFEVSYLHILLVTMIQLTFENNKSNKKTIFQLCLLLISFVIVYLVNCSTGMVGLIILLFGLLFRRKIVKLVQHPITLMVAFVFAISFVFMMGVYQHSSLYAWLVVDVFKHDLSISTRSFIFESIPEILNGHFLIGYGFGSGYEVALFFTGAADVQNGFYDIALQGGVLSAILFCVIIAYPFLLSRKQTVSSLYPCFLYILVFVLLSSIEITFDTRLLFMCLLCVLLEYEACSTSLNKMRGKQCMVV